MSPFIKSQSRKHRPTRANRFLGERLEQRIALSGQSPLPQGWQLSVSDLASANAKELDWRDQTVYAKENEWILKLSMSGRPSQQQVDQVHELIGDDEIDVVRHLGASGTFLVKSDPGLAPADLDASLRTLPGFQYYEPNFVIWQQSTIPNDPLFDDQWALENTGQTGGVSDADLDAATAWDTTIGSGNIIVGVVDTGVDWSHPDLAANMWVNPGEIAGDRIDNDVNGYVDDIHGWDFGDNDNDPMDVAGLDFAGHGTAVAGLIAAVGNNGIGVTGINWNAQIMALKVVNRQGGGFADTVAALNYATTMRRDYGINVRVTNHSYSSPFYSEAFREAIEANRDAGMLITAAAGNESLNNDAFPAYPSTYEAENVIAVAAMTHTDQLASFSNFGPSSVHVAAPGDEVFTTSLGGGYESFGGTSAASPLAAGVAALLWDAAPYATYDQIKTALMAGVDVLPSLQGKIISNGRVNAANSIELLGLRIVNVDVLNNNVAIAPPTTFAIRFAEPYEPLSISPTAFTVNGVSASSATLDDPFEVKFHFANSPVVNEGLQQIRLDASVEALGDPSMTNLALVTDFRYDTVVLAPETTSPQNGQVVDLPLESIRIVFNEPVDTDSLDTTDLRLSVGQVTGAIVVDANTVEYQIAGVEREGFFHWGIAAGTIRDVGGNPIHAFSSSVSLNAPVRDLTFARTTIPGSLIYVSEGNQGYANLAGQEDVFEIYLEAGETLTARVVPDNAMAAIAVTFAPIGATQTGAAGLPAILPTTTAPTAGVYQLRIASNLPTTYRFDVYRNAEIEWAETVNDASVTIGSSWALENAHRLGVLGTATEPPSAPEEPPEVAVLYSADMSTDPNWILTGGWSYGSPTGQSGDPAAGFDGPQVIGYNLDGEYADNLATVDTVTTPAISTVGYKNVSLGFQRWLGVESSFYDHAEIQFSTDGVFWESAWQNPTSSIGESSWTTQLVELPSDADNQPAVYLRWTLGPTDSSVTYWGWNLDNIVLTGEPAAPDIDIYLFEVSDPSSPLEVALRGQQRSFEDQLLEILTADGATVLATAHASASASADLELDSVMLPGAGSYLLRLTAVPLGTYEIVVTQGMSLEREPNDGASPDMQLLTEPRPIVGQIGVAEVQGTYALQIDSQLSSMRLEAALGSLDGSFRLEATPDFPGSLESQLGGVLTVAMDAGTFAIRSATVQLENDRVDDFAGTVAGIVTFSLSDLSFELGTDAIEVNDAGHFESGGLNAMFTQGEIDAFLLALELRGIGLAGIALDPASITGTVDALPGQLRVQLTIDGLIYQYDPITQLYMELRFLGSVVATTPLPVLNEDVYEVELVAGESYVLATNTLFDSAESQPFNTLDPALRLTTLDGDVLLSDDNSAGDGKNAQIEFTAPATGRYRLAVSAHSGQGEYSVSVTQQAAATVQVTGPEISVRGYPQAFGVSVDGALPGDVYTYQIDWDGDGTIDQVLSGPGAINVLHTYTALGNNTVSVTATASDDSVSAPAQITTSVRPFAARPDPVRPDVTNLAIGGTEGNDVYSFVAEAGGVRVVRWLEDGQPLQESTFFPGIDGSVVAFGFGGNDTLWSVLPPSLHAWLFGGGGNDLLIGGSGSDFLAGEAGNDLLIGGAGADTLIGGDGWDLIFAELGEDHVLNPLGDTVIYGATANSTRALRQRWASWFFTPTQAIDLALESLSSEVSLMKRLKAI